MQHFPPLQNTRAAGPSKETEPAEELPEIHAQFIPSNIHKSLIPHSY